MKAVLYVAEAVVFAAVIGGMTWGGLEAAEWLSGSLLHPPAAAVPVGVVLRLARGMRPVGALVRWHGVAVRRLDG